MSRIGFLPVIQGVVVAVGLSAGLHVAINGLPELWQGRSLSLAELLQGTVHPGAGFFLLLVAGMMALELAAVGWGRSSLRKIAVGEESSSRDDIVYTAVAVLGVQTTLASLLSGGLVEVVASALGTASLRGPLSEAPTWLAAPALYVGATFLNYWVHRLMHTRLLWPLHAIHHVAKEFTVLNVSRICMLEIVLIVLSQATALALIGGSAEALYWAGLVLAIESFWTHNNIRGVEWLERLGINTPKAHAIHHVLDPLYHHSNFGDGLCFWDKLFGTYIPSFQVSDELTFGIDDPEGLYDSGRPLRDLFMPQWMWLVRGARSAATFAGLAGAKVSP